ncbi:MAG: Gfo/Idh/MocA family oxidoreductase [bacterium]|nr:Gfo/Idh/MocA family oxidoreductase [bacterium]MDZ4284463.1 Gfo/Idh/MocA family oxidoreductase [Patescibacteria group bacterium]
MVLSAGLIGYGKRGEVLARIIREHVPEIEIVGVADPDQERRKHASFRHKIVASEKYTFATAQELFDKFIPAVSIIATNPPQHCELAVMAAERGCHIFCEKPLALSPDEADRMVAAARKAGVVSAVDFETTFADAFHVLEAYIGSEGFGTLYRFEAIDKGRPPAYDLEECTPHFLQALMHLTHSRPVEVFGRVIVDGRNATLDDVKLVSELYPAGRSHGIGMRADSIEATYRFENGVLAHLFLHGLDMDFLMRAGRDTPPGSEFMALVCYGTRGQIKWHQTSTGSVYVKNVPHDLLDEMQWRPVPSMWRADSDWVMPTARLLRDFVGAIHDPLRETRPRVSIGAASLVLDMTLGVYASHLAGRPVALPLVERRHPLAAR